MGGARQAVRCIAVLCLLLCGSVLSAEHAGLPLQRMPLDGALTQNTVIAILQDRSGLMWFGTQGGLNVYDGYRYHAVPADPRRADALYGARVSKLFEDRDGYIWVAGFLGWLDRIDPRTGEVRHYAGELYGDPDRPASGTTALYQAPDGALWIGTVFGLHRYDPAADTMQIQVDAVDGRAPVRDIRAIAADANGRLWLGSATGLHRYTPATGALQTFVHDPADPRTLSGNAVNTLHVDPDGTLWIGTQTGLNRWEGEGRGFTRYQHDPDDPTSLGGDNVMDILRDRLGRLWIAGLAGGGLSLWRDGHFQVFRNDPDDRNSLAVNDLYALYEDRSGLIWIGTAGRGLHQLNPSARRFNELRSIPFNSNSLRSSFVLDLQEDAQQRIWITTLAGLERYDPATRTFAIFEPLPGDIPRNQLQALHIDRGGRFWVGAVDGRLYRFDPDSGAFTAVPHPDHPDGRFANGRVWYLGEGAGGRIWVSGFDELVALDPLTAAIVERVPATASLPLGGTPVRASLVDSDGVLWFGGGGAGLMRHEPGKGITLVLSRRRGDPQSLSDNNVRSLYEDASGTLWVGTQNGLNRMAAKDRRAGRNRFTLYTQAEGLANDTIYGILPDTLGHLWLSTNRGLSRLDTTTGDVRNFDSADGLVGDEMNGGAELVASDGTLYFGGINGVTWFRPDAMPINPYVPPVRIIDVEVPGVAGGGNVLRQLTEVALAPQDPGVAVTFAAMDFHQPAKNRFRYRLAGHDAHWTETARNTVTLARLADGAYRLEVLGSNNDGIWSAEPAQLAIVVHAPWWRTPWAYAVYALLLLAALLLYHQLHRAKLRREREFSEQLARAHSLAEANHQLALRYAQYDPLTQLPNRLALMDALGRLMRIARSREQGLALWLINLDRFQRINDTIGQNLADRVLKTTAERVQAIAEEGDLVARVGGDEFVLAALQPAGVEQNTWLAINAARLTEAIAMPHVQHDPPLIMTASIGVSTLQPNVDTAGELIGQANVAMNAARRDGGKQVQRYQPGMYESARERLGIEDRMRRGLQANEFVAYYQPIIDVARRRLFGFEALIRWQPAGQPMIYPDQFIPIAEESGLIVDLGEFMIREACRQLARWRRWDLKISVNVSMRQLRGGKLIAIIRDALATTGVPPACLKLEITETAMMENVEDTADQLREIKQLGVGISVDDFGTGFSSLGHLQLLPVDEMKIDRGFVTDVATSERSRKIVSSIVRLSHELQLLVVAEGVEDEAALAYLKSIDCDLAQGYLFDKPRPAAELEANGWLDAPAKSVRGQ